MSYIPQLILINVCYLLFRAHLVFSLYWFCEFFWQSMIELSRTQDEEVGDGTTSVIILGLLLSSRFPSLSLFLIPSLSCSGSLSFSYSLSLSLPVSKSLDLFRLKRTLLYLRISQYIIICRSCKIDQVGLKPLSLSL